MIYRRMFGLPLQGWQSSFGDLERMRRDMDNLFNQISGGPYLSRQAGVFPAVNLTEDADYYYVRAELPGIKPEELDIQATGNNLSISGERSIPEEGQNVRYHRREREAGSFSRMISLPGDINADKVDANLAGGILTVTVPKAEVAKPKQITVK